MADIQFQVYGINLLVRLMAEPPADVRVHCPKGSPIRYGEVAMPVIRHDRQVLVKVTVVTVNPIGTYIRSGAYPIALPRPFIIGRDLVGVADAVGAGLTRFAPGQRVWSNNQGYGGRQGTFAELVSVDEELLYPLADGVNEQEAVAVVHSALTDAG